VITFENVVCGHDKESYKNEKFSAKTPILGGGRGQVQGRKKYERPQTQT